MTNLCFITIFARKYNFDATRYYNFDTARYYNFGTIKNMGIPNEKLATSLKALQYLQNKKGIVAIQNKDLSRTNKERLLKNGFLKEIAKGWYIITNPKEKVGDTTSWYINYWKFCAQYLQHKFGKNYCIAAEQSLQIQSGNLRVPHQLIVRAPKANNNVFNLMHTTSIFAMKSSIPKVASTEIKNHIRVMTVVYALVNSTENTFKNNKIALRTVLAQISDVSELLEALIAGSHSVIAGRIAGAFINIGRKNLADQIVKTMKAADYDVRIKDPFIDEAPIKLSFRDRSPYVNRIKLMWHNMRTEVLKVFPKSPGMPSNKINYLKTLKQIYVTDAYHSLSIENYKVDTALIEKVKSGKWDIDKEEDAAQRNAMAARGYWEASSKVVSSIEKILKGTNAGEITEAEHADWYLALFAPSVAAGLLAAKDLAGYRTQQVYIAQSMHVPLSKEALREAMPTFFELLIAEEEAAVRAVLGHFVFVYIHPYMDGNGRIGRFLMNVMLASGGYPWTVIPVEERDTYMDALEAASIDNNIQPFANFMAYLVKASLAGKPVAKLKVS